MILSVVKVLECTVFLIVEGTVKDFLEKYTGGTNCVLVGLYCEEQGFSFVCS